MMAAPSQEAQRSLREITEAAEGLVRVHSGSTRSRERALQALVDASSQPDLARRHFAPPGEREQPKALDWKEAIATAKLELQSANILAAASIVMGETVGIAGTAPVELLDRAVEYAKAELLQPQATQAFRGKIVRGEPSRDTPAAIENFKSAANQTIDSIVTDSDRVLSATLEEIKKRGKDLLAAFDSVAQFLSAGSQIEGLLKRAWEKLQSGLKFLSQILDSVPMKDVREKLQTVRDSLKPRNAIELLYRTSETRNIIAQLQFRAAFSEIEIDERRDQLTQLGREFNKFVTAATTISALASAVLAIVAAHLTGPFAVLAIPATHALAAAVVLLVGIGLNDAWTEIRQVRGIRDIAREVALVQAEGA